MTGRVLAKKNLNLTFEDIRTIKKTKFTQILKAKIQEVALRYLLEKQGKQSYLEIAEYLLPFNKKQSIEQKCEMFAMKNSIIDIPANFS